MFVVERRRKQGDGGIQKPPRSDKGKKHDNPETRLQVSCVNWCDAHDVFVDGSPGGAAFRKGAHSARGCRPGRADLLVLEAGVDGKLGLAVELKVGNNSLQDAHVRGWRAPNVRSGARVSHGRSRSSLRLCARICSRARLPLHVVSNLMM